MSPNKLPKAEIDAITEAVDFIGRNGAKSCEIGYLVDDPPPGIANWYVSVDFRRGTLTTDLQMTPGAAAVAMVELLQKNARCRWCLRPISWDERKPQEHCWWRKIAGRWERGCPRADAPAVPGDYRP